MSLPSPAIFGARLRRERESQKLTTGQVAIKGGLTSGRTVATAERAVHQPGIFTVARIARTLGVSLDSLLADPDCPRCDGYPPAGRSCPPVQDDGAAVSAVPGLVILRDVGARESWLIVHEPSGVAVILDLAGAATAELAAEAIGELLDWTMSAAGIADAADLLVYPEGAVERVASRYGGVTLGPQAVYVP